MAKKQKLWEKKPLLYQDFNLTSPETTPSPEQLASCYRLSPSLVIPFQELWQMYLLEDPSLSQSRVTPKHHVAMRWAVSLLSEKDQRLLGADFLTMALPLWQRFCPEPLQLPEAIDLIRQAASLKKPRTPSINSPSS